MISKTVIRASLSALAGGFLAATGQQSVSSADPLPYGPDTCMPGFVWREAAPNDHVCVTPEVRSDTTLQNMWAVHNRSPNGGAYGPDTCKQGYVWRDAFVGDHVCVVPNVREQAAADNAAATSRMAANQSAAAAGSDQASAEKAIATGYVTKINSCSATKGRSTQIASIDWDAPGFVPEQGGSGLITNIEPNIGGYFTARYVDDQWAIDFEFC